MSEEFLNASKVRSAFEQMSRRGVAQAVRTEIGCPGDRLERVVHDPPDAAGLQPAPARTDQKCRWRVRRGQLWPPIRQPVPHSALRGQPERNGPFLVALADHSHHTKIHVDVVDVKTTKLGNANSGGVQQFDDHVIPHRNGIPFGGARLRRPHQVIGLILTQHGRKSALPLGRDKPSPRIGGEIPTPVSPSSERPGSRRPTRQRRPASPSRALRGKPRPNTREIQFPLSRRRSRTNDIKPMNMPQKRNHIADIGPHSVRRKPTLSPKMPFIGVHHLLIRRRQISPNPKQVNPTTTTRRHNTTLRDHSNHVKHYPTWRVAPPGPMPHHRPTTTTRHPQSHPKRTPRPLPRHPDATYNPATQPRQS